MGLSLVSPTKESNPWISTKRLGGKRGSVELLVKRGTTTELVVALWPRPATHPHQKRERLQTHARTYRPRMLEDSVRSRNEPNAL